MANPQRDIELRVMDLLCLVYDNPWHDVLTKQLNKLLTEIHASASRGVVHQGCPHCRMVVSKVTGDDQ